MRKPNMVVFFTRGMSLEGWQQAGILDRELALYQELMDDLGALAFVTYGNGDDVRWARQLPRLEVLCNRWGLPSNLYSVLAPCLHWRRLRQATLFRTNQINGAWCGVIAKAMFRRPLVVRCGHLWADFVARLTPSAWRRFVARALERMVVGAADRIVTAGDADRQTLIERYGADAARFVVVPNYVDPSRFRPVAGVTPEPGRLLFVGRLEDQKNVGALIEAVRTLPEASLTIVGEGTLRPELEAAARAAGARIEFLGRVAHEQLPALLCRSQIFVLPSHYEGNPKALFEAMACGVPVVAARTPGITAVIQDGVNGLLCGTSPSEVRAAVARLLGDDQLRASLRSGGLAWVRDRCSLARAVESEKRLLATFDTPITEGLP
jgi:glycosyltransferase involved in cell wall biosynthesis